MHKKRLMDFQRKHALNLKKPSCENLYLKTNFTQCDAISLGTVFWEMSSRTALTWHINEGSILDQKYEKQICWDL